MDGPLSPGTLIGAALDGMQPHIGEIILAALSLGAAVYAVVLCWRLAMHFMGRGHYTGFWR